MPLLPQDTANAFYGNNLAFQLVENLTNKYRHRLEIIGPTTTGTHSMEELVAQLNIHYVINSRFSIHENKSRFLAEVIRVSDRAHVWVKAFGATVEPDSITQQITQGVLGVLELEATTVAP